MSNNNQRPQSHVTSKISYNNGQRAQTTNSSHWSPLARPAPHKERAAQSQHDHESATSMARTNSAKHIARPLPAADWIRIGNEADILVKVGPDPDIRPLIFQSPAIYITRLLASPLGMVTLSRIGKTLDHTPEHRRADPTYTAITRLIQDFAALNTRSTATQPSSDAFKYRNLCKCITAATQHVYLPNYDRCSQWGMPTSLEQFQYQLPTYSYDGQRLSSIDIHDFQNELRDVRRSVTTAPHHNNGDIMRRVIEHARSNIPITITPNTADLICAHVYSLDDTIFISRVHDGSAIRHTCVRDATYALCRLGLLLNNSVQDAGGKQEANFNPGHSEGQTNASHTHKSRSDAQQTGNSMELVITEDLTPAEYDMPAGADQPSDQPGEASLVTQEHVQPQLPVYWCDGGQVMHLVDNPQDFQGVMFDKYGAICDKFGYVSPTFTEWKATNQGMTACLGDETESTVSLESSQDQDHVFLAKRMQRALVQRLQRNNSEETKSKRTIRDKIEETVGIHVLRSPATVKGQLTLIASPEIADDLDYACLFYQDNNLLAKIVAASLEVRGYDCTQTERVTLAILWLAENGDKVTHDLILGTNHGLDISYIKQLGFGSQSQPGAWNYAHLCYTEAVLQVSLYAIGPADFAMPEGLNIHEAAGIQWETSCNNDYLPPLTEQSAHQSNLRWYSLTHRGSERWDDSVLIAQLVPRFEPILESLLQLPERYLDQGRRYNLKSDILHLPICRTPEQLKQLEKDDATVYSRHHVDTFIRRDPYSNSLRVKRLEWDNYDIPEREHTSKTLSIGILRRSYVAGETHTPQRRQLHVTRGRSMLTLVEPTISGTSGDNGDKQSEAEPQYIPMASIKVAIWEGTCELGETRAGLPFHSLVQLILPQDRAILDKRHAHMRQQIVNTQPVPSDDDIAKALAKGNYMLSSDIDKDNTYPNPRDNPVKAYNNKMQKYAKWSRLQIADTNSRIAKCLHKLQLTIDSKDVQLKAAYESEQSHKTRTPPRPYLRHRKELDSKGKFATAMHEARNGNRVEEEPEYTIWIKVQNLLSNTQQRHATPGPLPRVDKGPSKVVKLDLTDDNKIDIHEDVIQRWQPLLDQPNVLYNKVLQQYKLENVIYLRKPGTDDINSLALVTDNKDKIYSSDVLRDFISSSSTHNHTTRYLLMDDISDENLKTLSSELPLWLQAVEQTFTDDPRLGAPFRTTTAQMYAAALQRMSMGLEPINVSPAPPRFCRPFIAEPFMPPRHVTEATIHPNDLPSTPTLLQLAQDVHNETLHPSHATVLHSLLRIARAHIHFHLSSTPHARTRHAINLKLFLDLWLPSLLRLSCGGQTLPILCCH